MIDFLTAFRKIINCSEIKRNWCRLIRLKEQDKLRLTYKAEKFTMKENFALNVDKG